MQPVDAERVLVIRACLQHPVGAEKLREWLEEALQAAEDAAANTPKG